MKLTKGFVRALIFAIVAVGIAFLMDAVMARAQAGAKQGASATATAHTQWSDFGGGPDSAQYSSLTQINPSNVSKLQVAWTSPTGDEARYFFEPV
ncbi:MAG TPA: hypothetical protein VN727_15055, partial [Candidatus Binatia bacterium]|nr:hypothetical protein [Candidatus Binatia bacterium]